MPKIDSAQPAKEILILDAAQKCFAAFGYAKTTMDEIAEGVGMCKAALYYYYPTKEAVFRSVIRKEQDVFLAGLRAIMRKRSGACEKLRAYALLRIELTERLLNLNRINQQQRDDVHSIFHDLFRTFDVQEQQCLIQILRSGIKSRELALAHIQPAALMIQHVLQGLRLRLVKVREHTAGSNDVNHEWRSESLLFIETMLHGIVNAK
jgi:TetR/AcrR family transcriptional regulator